MGRSLLGGLRATFVAGLIVVVPAVATFLTLRFLFQSADGLLAPPLGAALGRDVPGLGLLTTLALVLLAGVLARSYAGKRFVRLGDRAVAHIPFVRSIYRAAREIVETATLSRRQVFREVVLLEYPRRGMYSYGFVTAYTSWARDGRTVELANVFIPGPPVPTTGVLVAVPVDQLVYLDLSVEAALKLVLSGGIVVPARLPTRAPGAVPGLRSPGADGAPAA